MTGLKRPAVVNSNSQTCLNFSFSCTLEHRVLQTYAGPIGNTGWAVSLGLMNSEGNYSWHSQRRINTLIRINGNRIIFSPDTVIALSHFCSLCCYQQNSPSPSHHPPAIVSASPFLTPFSFSKPAHFFSSSSLNPTHPSRKSWEMGPSHLLAPVIVCIL